MEDRVRRLIEVLSDNSIDCSDDKAQKLLIYYDMLIEKNKYMNLTAITEFQEVALKHFADSLSICRVASLSDQKVIDIGTGAGFPGIPLKIMYPDIEITLLDSLNKRILFLDEVISNLHLNKIFTIHGRAEELARKGEYREQYDFAVSRAVANLSSLSELCLPFVKTGGYFISYKGSKAVEELSLAGNAISTLGGKVEKNDSFVLSGSYFERSLICIKKIINTTDKYPRGGGKPLNNPL